MLVVFMEFAANAVLGQLIIDVRNCLVLKPLSPAIVLAHVDETRQAGACAATRTYKGKLH